jgi:hypothetical protein
MNSVPVPLFLKISKMNLTAVKPHWGDNILQYRDVISFFLFFIFGLI